LGEILGFEPEIIICSSEHGEVDLSNKNQIAPAKTRETDERAPSDEKRTLNDFKAQYTFDNFIIGSSNKFAYAAAEAVAKKNFDEPDLLNTYNPLFIYGPSGVGKTHLLYAITNQISKNYPDKKIIYVKGEEFMNQLIDSLNKKTMIQFKEKYRKIDVLLIDDVQFVAGKVSVQEEIFNTFNAIYEDKKQIILTSDRPPHEMKQLEDRLRTRFMSGLIADIQLPDFDLRVAILKQKSTQNNIILSNEVLNFLAENVTSSIRQLEGVIKKIGAVQLLEGGEMSLERVKNSIKEFIPVKTSDSKRIDDIIMTVSKKFNVSKDDLVSSKRNKEIAIPRHICIYVAKNITSLNHSQIAKAFNRDRTTAISSEEFVRTEMEKDTDFAITVKEIIRELNS
jgi:chromosomal replication initiator protein